MTTSTIQYANTNEGTVHFLEVMVGFEFLAVCIISVICMALVYSK